MARVDDVATHEAVWPLKNPWPVLLAGLAATALALLWASVLHDTLVPLRVMLLVAGLIAGGLAVAVRFRVAGWIDMEERVHTAGVLALAALVAVLGNLALDDEWDSAQLLLRVLTVVALVGAGLVCLSQAWRRALISLLVIIHFGGILCAVTSVPPPGGSSPWVTGQLWARFYRPYLDFMYLNNAYHFYSPEPGPPSLLWFYVEYEDGSIREIKIPNREDFPTRLAYQRRLALTESCAQVMPTDPGRLEEMAYKRRMAGLAHAPQIPMHPEMAVSFQYAEPNNYSKAMLASYARHAANSYPSEVNPELAVKRVKVYRLIHSIVMASDFSHGMDPLDPALYIPYYEGEFDREGNLLHPEDPFLYWVIPILRVEKAPQFEEPKDEGPFRLRMPCRPKAGTQPEYEIKNFLDIHAGVQK